jgi:hypothetical protein
VTVKEAVFELPLSDAVTVTEAFVLTVPAVAVKLAVAAPATTATEAGTASAELLSETATEAPPLGAAPESVTVQIEVPPEVTVAGEHDTAEIVRSGCITLIALPVPETVTCIPLDRTPITPLSGRDTAELLVLAESLTVTTATTPVPTVFAFMPLVTHFTDPAAEAHVTTLPADVSAAPAATLTDATSLVGYEIVHARPAGALPLEAVKERFRASEPPGTTDPEAKLKDVA